MNVNDDISPKKIVQNNKIHSIKVDAVVSDIDNTCDSAKNYICNDKKYDKTNVQNNKVSYEADEISDMLEFIKN